MVTYPSDWKEIKIGDTGRVITGSTPSTSNKHYWGKEYTWITPTDIDDRVFMYSSERKLSKQGFEISRQLPPGSVLITCIASIGKNCILAGVGSCNQQINAIIPSEKYDSRYIYYLMNFSKDTLENLAGITATKILNKKTFEAIKFCVPELSEQQTIASVLSDFDEHIYNLAELIEKKNAIRDGALDDLVSGRTRLDGFEGEWEEGTIGEILTIHHGKNQHSVESFDGKYPILGTGGVIGKATEYLCDWECVLIGRKGTIDNPMYMNTPFWTIDTLYYSKPKINQCVKFQYYLFCTINWLDYAESSGRPSLAKDVIEGVPINIPSIPEQQAIAQVLSAMDDEIESLETEKEKMMQIKVGAMDDLLTGRVRLNV